MFIKRLSSAYCGNTCIPAMVVGWVRCGALALLLAIGLAAPEVRAQFVCADSGGGTGGATAVADSVACGTNAAASSIAAVAVGRNASATNNATAIGDGATGVLFGVAVGSGADASNAAVAVGYNADAENGAVAIGNTSNANENAVAVGLISSAGGEQSMALGNLADATDNAAVAVGFSADATAINAMALGANAEAQAENSVALGAGSVATEAGTVSIGTPGSERRLVNIAPGISATDAVNRAQLDSGLTQTLEAARQYTDEVFAGSGGGSIVNTIIKDMSDEIRRQNNRINAMGAMATAGMVAAASVPGRSCESFRKCLGHGDFAAGIGHLEGEMAGAILFAQPLPRGRLTLGASFADSDVSTGIGVSFGF